MTQRRLHCTIHGCHAASPWWTALLTYSNSCPRPIDNLEKLFAQNNGIPLMTRCTPRDIYEKIDIMKQGRLILMLSAGSLDEAEEAIAFLRKETA